METKKKNAKPAASKTKPEEKKPDTAVVTMGIRHDFTPDERINFATIAAEAAELIATKEQEFDSVKASHKADIVGLEARQSAAFTSFRTGYEMRQEACIVEFNAPESGRKSIFLLDDKKKEKKGEFVRDELMTPADLQRELPIEGGLPEDLINKGTELVRKEGKASVSMLQRGLSLGYTVASKLMDKLQQLNVVGPAKGAEPREVLDVDQVAEDMLTQAAHILRTFPLNDDDRADMPGVLAGEGERGIGINYERACAVLVELEKRGVVTPLSWEADDSSPHDPVQRRRVIQSGINPVLPPPTKEQVREYLNGGENE